MNGECHVGAMNIANIENQRRRTDALEKKLDWVFYTMVITLVTSVINLIT